MIVPKLQIQLMLVTAAAISFIGCRTQPSASFLTDESGKLVNLHSESTVTVHSGDVISLEMQQASFPILPEADVSKGKPIKTEVEKHIRKQGLPHSIGDREIFMYAVIYKNGYMSGFEVISDISENNLTHNLVTITNPVFYTGTVDSGYVQIQIKAYEVDTKYLVKTVRRVEQLDFNELETSYNFGASLATGITETLKGLTSIAVSVTGRDLDKLLAQLKSQKVFDHSIYIVPNKYAASDSPSPESLIVVSNSRKNRFLEVDPASAQTVSESITTFKDEVNGDSEINAPRKLADSAYVVMKVHRLEAPEE